MQFKGLQYGVRPYNPEGNPLTVEFWVQITELFDSSRKNLHGTGLWKLSLHASEKDVKTFNAEHEQVLSSAENSKALNGGEKPVLEVTSKPTMMNGMGGCPGEKQFICFKLSKGDNPVPDFDLQQPMNGCLKFNLPCKGNVETDFDSFQMFLKMNVLKAVYIFGKRYVDASILYIKNQEICTETISL